MHIRPDAAASVSIQDPWHDLYYEPDLVTCFFRTLLELLLLLVFLSLLCILQEVELVL